MWKVKTFVMSFIVAFFCFSLMLMATLLWVQPYSKTSAAPARTNILLPKEEDQLELLLVHQEETVKSFSYLSVDPYKGKIKIRTFPPTSVINGEKLEQLWQSRPEDMQNLLNNYLNVSIKRQIILSDLDFVALMDQIAPLSITIDEGFQVVKNGMEIIMEAGTHSMDGELLLQYLNQTKNPVKYIQRSQLILQIYLEKLFPVLSQELFLDLLNYMDSDLTLDDFDQISGSLSFMSELLVGSFIEVYSGS